MAEISNIMKGKRGLILGVANDRSIAWGIARFLYDHGAELAFTYQGEAFDAFRFALFEHEPDRPERLEHAAFAAADPEEMLIDEVEAIWAPIAEADDWATFAAVIEEIGEMGRAYGVETFTIN